MPHAVHECSGAVRGLGGLVSDREGRLSDAEMVLTISVTWRSCVGQAPLSFEWWMRAAGDG